MIIQTAKEDEPMPDQQTRLHIFQELVACCHALYLWTYDPQMNLLETNCPEDVIANGLIAPDSHWDSIMENIDRYRKPVIMSNDLGLMWIAAGCFGESEATRIHILGPFFMYDISAAAIEAELRRRNLIQELKQSALHFLQELPVITLNRVLEYGVMLHFCITGQKLSVKEIRFQDDQSGTISAAEVEGIHGTYEAEKEMLRLVREGDLNYKNHMRIMAGTGRVGNISDGQTLRQLKNMIIVTITLFSRAAMDGGLPPETAYTLSDRYYQAVEKSRSIQSILDINSAMQDDFVNRVHQFRQNEGFSMPIRICMEQMRTRMEEKLTLEQLAREFGYSTYYLSRKFRQETGQSFKDHLRQIRLERAKFLLRNTDEPILSISERLQFCSPSYFSDIFRKFCGMSPTEYREKPDQN